MVDAITIWEQHSRNKSACAKKHYLSKISQKNLKVIGDDLQTHLLHASLACNLVIICISRQSLATDDINLLDVL